MIDAWMMTGGVVVVALFSALRVWLDTRERMERVAESVERRLAERRPEPWPAPPDVPRPVHASEARPPGYRDPAPTVVHIATKLGPLCGPRDRFTAAVIGAPQSPTCEDCRAIAKRLCNDYVAGREVTPGGAPLAAEVSR